MGKSGPTGPSPRLFPSTFPEAMKPPDAPTVKVIGNQLPTATIVGECGMNSAS